MSERNRGIDALRILCMLGILLFHIFDFGLYKAQDFAQWPAWLLRSITFGAVDCYGMISGYVGWNRKVRIRNYILLWLQVAFYSLLITALFAAIRPDLLTGKSIVSAFFPVFSRQYWYFTAYTAVFILMPLLNGAIRSVSRNASIAFIAVFFFFFSLIPALTWLDPFYTEQGKSAVWLILMYLLGGLIGRHRLLDKLSDLRLTLIFAGCVFIPVLSLPVMARLSSVLYQDGRLTDRLFSHQSPFVIAAAAVSIVFHARRRTGQRLAKVIATLVPLTFAVYLIHVHPLIWELLPDSCVFMTSYSWPIMMLMSLVVALAVMIPCMAIDYVRIRLFKLLRLPLLADRIEVCFTQMMTHNDQ